MDDPVRVASTLSTKSRYENDITNINDYQVEEQRRNVVRQNQAKVSNVANQSKREKPGHKMNIETEFDSTKYFSTEKILGKRLKTDNNDKSNFQKPRQPKKERSLTKQLDEVKFLKTFTQKERIVLF